ncbi:MAG: hypothetical protein QXY26_07840 [Ignisphaera sp.]
MFNTPFKDRSDLSLLKFNTVFFENSLMVYLRGVGGIYSYGHKIAEVFAEKRLEVLENGYRLRYSLRNINDNAIEGKIGIEYHLAWKIDRDQERSSWYVVDGHIYDINSWFIGKGSIIKLHSPGYHPIVLKPSGEKEIWIAKLVSYARTEKGMKEIPQGLGVMVIDSIELRRNDTYEVEIEHIVEA